MGVAENGRWENASFLSLRRRLGCWRAFAWLSCLAWAGGAHARMRAVQRARQGGRGFSTHVCVCVCVCLRGKWTFLLCEMGWVFTLAS